ncbi:MAG: ComEC/Rec2 family competence protein [Bacillota bacterium]|nr:ComEC/Rec2 family competence protein [Bacillota bacterium]
MKKPLVYFAVSIFLGCLSSYMIKDSFMQGAALILAASFLLIIFFTINKRFFIIILFFYLIGIVTFMLYFDISYKSNSIKLRIIQNKNNYSIAEFNGKDILLYSNEANLEEGRNITAYGTFKPKADYANGIVGQFNAYKIKKCNKDYIYYLYDIKRKISSKFSESLGSEKSAIVMSLCFGDTKNLTQNQKNQFQQLGVIHAVSVSGFHIALIFQIIECLLGMIPASLISIVYIIFTGLQPATIRSFIMIITLKLSKKFCKKYDGLSSLSLSAMIILCYKPFYVLNSGFILTILATLGIILFYKKLKRFFYFLPTKINESISLTFSAQTFSMPYAAMTFGNISWGFILGNIFLAPIYSAIVIIGNSALIFMKINFIFKFLNFLLKNLLIALDGADYILLKLSPPVVSAGFLDGIVLLSVIVSYILVKYNHKKFILVPALMFVLIIFKNYYVFPEVQVLNSGSYDNILLKYHSETILLTNDTKDKKSNLCSKYGADKVINNFQNGCTIKFNNNLIFSVSSDYGKKYKAIDLNLHSNNRKIVFTRYSDKLKDLDEKCVIIELPKKKYFGNNNSLILSDKDFIKYMIISNKVYSLS